MYLKTIFNLRSTYKLIQKTLEIRNLYKFCSKQRSKQCQNYYRKTYSTWHSFFHCKIVFSGRLEVTQNNDARYVDGIEIRSVNFGPVAFFSKTELITSSGNFREKVEKLHTASLMYKL